MSVEQNSAEILERAAELLETGGWCQGSYFTDDGQHCAIGAVKAAVAGRVSRYPDAVRLLAKAVNKDLTKFAFSHDAVVSWNDYPVRTADEVIETMKLVAKDLRNQAAPE